MKKILLILILLPALARSAVLTVCASGCDHTSIASAYAAAGSTDIIEIQEDRTEGLTVNKNIAGLQSDTGARTWDNTGSGGSHTLIFTTGVTQAITVRNIILDHSSGNADTFRINGRSAGGKVFIQDVHLIHSSGSGSEVVNDIAAGNAVDNMVFERVTFEGNGADDNFRSTAGTTAGMYRFQSCWFNDGDISIRIPVSTSNIVAKVYNCTISNAAIGMSLGQRGDFQNNVFVNNADDLSLTGASEDVADFSTNAFEEQTDTGGFGADNIFGIVDTDNFTDPDAGDFTVKGIASPIYNSGVTLVTVLDDLLGVSRPQNGVYDIGSYEGVFKFLILDTDRTRRGIR